jgi:hypothetical protein
VPPLTQVQPVRPITKTGDSIFRAEATTAPTEARGHRLGPLGVVPREVANG